MDKEGIYDTQIFPLVEKIIDICTEHNISTILHFNIPTADDPTLAVTTLLGDENGIPDDLNLIKNLLMAGSVPIDHEEIIDKDSGQTVVADKKCAHLFKKGIN